MDSLRSLSRRSCCRILSATPLLAGVSGKGASARQLPPGCSGVTSWIWPQGVNRENFPLISGVPICLHWSQVEPGPGEYQFEETLGQRLEELRKNDFSTFLMIWVGRHGPAWLYDLGVPKVEVTRTISPQRKSRAHTYPYYFDDEYATRYHRLIREFGRYVRGLPDEPRRRIGFVCVCEGSTGDGYCYKGDPLNPSYAISREEWRRFRVRAWEVFREAFASGDRPEVPLLFNDDANRELEHDWLLRNLEVFGLKQGMFSHGYHISDGARRLRNWRAFLAEAEAAGKTVFTRGEMDAEFNICGWHTRNPAQSLYWSALYATHCGLDLWNLTTNACTGTRHKDTIEFFTKYAGKRDPATSPGAFCALRRGLDASDVEAFPEPAFGLARKNNVERYLQIAAAFGGQGAYQGDPEKAIGGGMRNRQRDDYNDVGWGILPGNYWRFLEQIDPEATSVAWWHIGPEEHHYSRFARGTEQRSGKTALYFRLDERSFANPRSKAIRVRVAYLDRGTGKWALVHAGQDGPETALEVQCRDSGQWKEAATRIANAVFHGGLPRSSDLMLEHRGGDDVVFHILELDRSC